MLDLNSYRERQNKFVIKCWMIIALVLTFAYFGEFVKGLRDINYVMTFLIMTWTPLVVNIVLLYYMGVSNINIRFYIITGYLVFYSFVMFTTVTSMSFVYIVPMISVLVVYNDEKVISVAYNWAIGINVMYILFRLMHGQSSSEDITNYEIQMACLLLSRYYLVGASKSLRFSYDNMLRLSNEVELDELTGLYNRHMLRQTSKKFFEEDFKNVSIAVIDIDKFKQFNDNYGHKFGDLVLKRVSKIIKSEISGLIDVHAFRTGGDEFLILGKDVDYDIIYQRCLDICKHIGELKLIYNKQVVGVQVSIGLADTSENKCNNYDDLFTEADSNLYVAKNNGRNTVHRGDNSTSETTVD